MIATLDGEQPVVGPAVVKLPVQHPDRWRCSKNVAGMALILGLFQWFYSSQRLHHTDLWGHMAYGRLIATASRLPTTEPLMPLSNNIPFVDTAWLSQVLGYQCLSAWGPAGIQFLHALAITVVHLSVVGVCYRMSGTWICGLVGLVVLELLNWIQFQIVRPQLAGLACYCLVLSILTAQRWRTAYWIFIPGIFALWANLHGSFVLGWLLLACATVGRMIEVWCRKQRLSSLGHNRNVRRLLLVTALAVAASLANPYGPRLFVEVLQFTANPNLHSLIEWAPLDFRTFQGKTAAVTTLALISVYSLRQRRATVAEVLALVTTGAAALYSARLLVWWSPLAAVAVAVQAMAAWQRFFPNRKAEAVPVQSGKWLAVSLGLIGISCACTPLGERVLLGKSPALSDSVSADTPLGATEWLQEHPPKGLIFNTMEWGDYFVWAGPPSLKVFVTSHVHLVPRNVWRDYLTVIERGPDWSEVLRRYDIETIIVDQADRASLIVRLRKDSRWKLTYEDRLAAIFVRLGNADSTEH